MIPYICKLVKTCLSYYPDGLASTCVWWRMASTRTVDPGLVTHHHQARECLPAKAKNQVSVRSESWRSWCLMIYSCLNWSEFNLDKSSVVWNGWHVAQCICMFSSNGFFLQKLSTLKVIDCVSHIAQSSQRNIVLGSPFIWISMLSDTCHLTFCLENGLNFQPHACDMNRVTTFGSIQFFTSVISASVLVLSGMCRKASLSIEELHPYLL